MLNLAKRSGLGRVVCCGLLVCLLLGFGGGAVAQDAVEPAVAAEIVPQSVADLAAIERRVTDVIERVSAATVCVQPRGGSGSGVIISEDGYVLTAGHVSAVPGQPIRIVFPDGKTARAKSLGINVGVDAGLVKITDEGPWPHVEMGSLEGVKAGTWVVALGHPGGFDLDRPMVARLGRVLRVRADVMQTDCTIIGGDSGGPLFDLDGKVIGIHSRISRSLRQNYHVPVSVYEKDWERLAAGDLWNRPAHRGGVKPGGPFIGVQGDTRDRMGKGAGLSRVYPGTPASAAGLRSGDMVVELDGKLIGSFGDLVAVVGGLSPGDQVGVVVERRGERMKLKMVIGRSEVAE